MEIRYISAIDACNAVKEGALLLDVREEVETSDIYVDMENVIFVPFTALAKQEKELPKNKHIIVCCATGIVSKKAAFLLMENGYADISVMENGLLAWKVADLPLRSKEETCCKCKCHNNKEDEN